MSATPEQILQVRWEVQDVSPELPILDDTTYDYLLQKQNYNIVRASIDAARMILFKLSINSTDKTTDILSVKGSKAAEAYRLALKEFLANPSLNPLINNANCYAGGISNQDIADNLADLDQNTVTPPISTFSKTTKTSSVYSYDNPFMI